MSDAPGQNQLVSYYHQYIGDPDRTIDIYAGFGTFFLGLGLGLAGIVIFLYGASLSETAYALREIAVVTGAIGAPALLVGVVILLPVDKRMLAVAGGGSVICMVGIARFVSAYPTNFNVGGADATAEVVGIYSVGLVLVVAATAAALIAHRVEQASATVATESEDDEAETVSDEEVEADIQRELEDAEISWGGVEKRETRRLNLDTSALDDVDRENLPESSIETRTSDSSVDDAVSQLQGLQGGNMKTASGQSTDDQAAALSELKQQQQASTESDPTLFEKLRNLLFGK
jgi:hypothetical protein